ncbi:hypothetical protein TKK_0002849 [Trichogramma kaykai]
MDHARLPAVNLINTNVLVVMNNRFSEEMDGRPARKSDLYRAGSRRTYGVFAGMMPGKIEPYIVSSSYIFLQFAWIHRNDFPNLWANLSSDQVRGDGTVCNLNQSEFKDLLYFHILDNDDNVHYSDNAAPTYYHRNMTKSELHKYYRKINTGKKVVPKLNLPLIIQDLSYDRLLQIMPSCHLPRITYQDAWLYGTRAENEAYYNNWRAILEGLGYPLRDAKRAAFIREVEGNAIYELPDPAGIDRNEIAAFEELIPRPPPAVIIDPTVEPAPRPANFPNARMIILDRWGQPNAQANIPPCEPNADLVPAVAPPNNLTEQDPNIDLMANMHRDANALANQFLHEVDLDLNNDDEYDHDAPHDDENDIPQPEDQPEDEPELPEPQQVGKNNVP